jgi:hypothetical protein
MKYTTHLYYTTGDEEHYVGFELHNTKQEATRRMYVVAQDAIKSPSHAAPYCRFSNSYALHIKCTQNSNNKVIFDQFIVSWDGRSFDVDDMFSTIIHQDITDNHIVSVIANVSCDISLTTIYGPSSGTETYLSRGVCVYNDCKFSRFKSVNRVMYQRTEDKNLNKAHDKALSVIAKKIGMLYG